MLSHIFLQCVPGISNGFHQFIANRFMPIIEYNTKLVASSKSNSFMLILRKYSVELAA